MTTGLAQFCWNPLHFKTFWSIKRKIKIYQAPNILYKNAILLQITARAYVINIIHSKNHKVQSIFSVSTEYQLILWKRIAGTAVWTSWLKAKNDQIKWNLEGSIPLTWSKKTNICLRSLRMTQNDLLHKLCKLCG